MRALKMGEWRYHIVLRCTSLLDHGYSSDECGLLHLLLRKADAHARFIGYCGNSLTGNGATGAVAASSNCQTTCAGDSSQKCGGGWFLSVFKASTGGSTTTTSTKTSTTPTPTPATWNNYGCVLEGTTGTRRSLTGASFTLTTMTPTVCQGLCAGYLYAGTEYG